MNTGFDYFRDQIVIDDNFRNNLWRRCGGKAAGSTVVVAARVITHSPPNYELRIGLGSRTGQPDLTGLNLIIVADSYNAPSGSINASGWMPAQTGQAGAKGASGTTSTDPRFQKPGGPGGPGGSGFPGTAAGQVTVVARTYALGAVRADGGAGSSGGEGGEGGEGADGSIPKKVGLPFIPGTAGGPGGPGGPGGAGGPGGQVNIFLVDGNAFCSANGGTPGRGGAGGPGGPAGQVSNNKPGATGPSGPNGPAGAPGSYQVTRLTDDTPGQPEPDGTYWAQVIQTLGNDGSGAPLASLWSDWRTRVAEYYFRSFNSTQPPSLSGDPKTLSFTEVKAALRLNPDNAKALTLAHYFALGMNIFGLYRYAWIQPDFDNYNSTAMEFQALVNGPVGNIVTLLDATKTTQDRESTLREQATELQNQRKALQDEIDRAQLDLQAAQAVQAVLRNTLDEDKALLQQNQASLAQAQMQVEEDNVFKTIGTVFQVGIDLVEIVVGAYTGQPFAVAGGFADLIPILEGNDPSTINVSRVTQTLQVAQRNADGSTKKLLEADDFYDSEATVPAAGDGSSTGSLYGGLSSMVKAVTPFLNRQLAQAQTETARYQNLQAQYATLVRKVVGDSFALWAGTLRTRAAQSGLNAANDRNEANDKNFQFLNSQADHLAEQLAGLAPALHGLLASARVFQDLINRYVFLAARAAEIWMMTDMTDEVDYTIGFTYPDAEADAFFALEYPALGPGSIGASDPHTILQYATADVAGNWNKFPEMLYKARYDQYNQDLNTETVFVHLSDAALLQDLRANHKVTFQVTAGDLPAKRTQFKLDRVRLALLGAAATDPTFSCLLTHGGDFSNVRADGSSIVVEAPPAGPVIVPARTTPFVADEAGYQPVRQEFWGRSPQAAWTLTIEDDIIAASHVDLSGLTQIELQIEVLCKVSP